MSASKDIVIDQGATFSLTLSCVRNGVEVDLTGWTITGKGRAYFGAEEVVFTFDGSSQPQAGSGIIIVTIPASVTSLLAPGRGVYDVFATLGSEVKKLVQGAYNIHAAVTV